MLKVIEVDGASIGSPFLLVRGDTRVKSIRDG
jgi:hypothetical protein